MKIMLDLQSERFAATGNVTGQGARRSLGTPTLDALHILVRETTQNAWDARLDAAKHLRLRFHLRELSTSHRRHLSEVLAELPCGGSTRTQLRESLAREDLRILEVSDFGTVGLGGPVRADAPVSELDRPDFVNFFRNVGSARDRRLGGGTYGYGKSASYRLSRCATILAYTQTQEAGRAVARFMGASIGDDFSHQNRKFTGRHWWGKRATDRVVDPVTGAAAHRCATSVGFERRASSDTGTCIGILDPDLEPRSAVQVMNAIAESLLWFFWPKMIRDEVGSPSMSFELALDGKPFPMPSVEEFPPLETFVAAMRLIKSNKGQTIRCERPQQDLGQIAFAKTPRRSRSILDSGDDRALIPEFCSHVALMRPAELVVRYIQGPALTSDRVEYGGVFICNEDVEQHFADAEPPAHDDWIPDFLEGRARSFVRVALRRISEASERFAVPPQNGVRESDQTTLAALGDALGGVLIGQVGSRLGGSKVPPQPRSNGARKAVRISQPEPFRFAMVRRVPCALFRLRVWASSRQQLSLRANPLLVLEGGALVDPPPDLGVEVVAWLDGTGDVKVLGSEITVEVDKELPLLVALRLNPEAAVAVNVESVEAG